MEGPFHFRKTRRYPFIYLGNGELFFEDGKVYKGQFSHGKMDGKGCLHFKNGDIFEGYFK